MSTKKKQKFYEASSFDVIAIQVRNISNFDEYIEDEIRKTNKKVIMWITFIHL